MRDPGGLRFFALVSAVAFAVAGYLYWAHVPLTPPHRAHARLHYVIEIAPQPPASPPPGLFWLSPTYRYGDSRLVDVVAAGDVMMGSRDQGLDPRLDGNPRVSALVGGDLVAIFRRADVAFVNLEGPLYDGDDEPAKTCERCFVFRSPTTYAGLLAQLGIRAVSLANNHSGDYGTAGRDATLAALRTNNIGFFGLDRDGARVPEFKLRNGGRAAIVSFSPNTGTLDINDLDAETRLIRALKQTHACIVISFHGGGEGEAHEHVEAGHDFYEGEDRGDVVAFAHRAIDAGADIVIGQGPHVPRALEIYRGHLVAYSLGNFWTYGAIDTTAVRGAGPVLEAWLAPDGSIAGFAIHSTEQHDSGVPQIDPAGEAEQQILALTRSDFPETAARLDDARDGRGRRAGS